VNALQLTLAAGAALGSYLLGSIPTALLVARLAGGPDPRTVGTGNAGASNVLVSSGVVAGLAVFLVDVAKGPVAATCGLVLAGPFGAAAAALAAIAGQVAPVFASFRGGKGVATTLGAYLALVPAFAVLGIATWLVALLLVRRFVIATLIAMIGLAVSAVALDVYPAFAIPAALISLFAHRRDIATWRRGEMRTVGETLRDNRPAR